MPDHEMRRKGDQGPIGKTKSFMQEWGWAFYIVGGIALLMGFSYRTPKDELNDIKSEQTILRDAVDTLKAVTRAQAADIKSVSLLQCFNKSYTNGQLRLVGIDCRGIRE